MSAKTLEEALIAQNEKANRNMEKVTYTLPPLLVSQLRKKAKESNATMSDIIRRALEAYFKNEGK